MKATQGKRDRLIRILALTLLLCAARNAHAQTKLLAIDTEHHPGGSVLIKLQLDSHAVIPSAFALENPARIVLDLFDTQSELAQPEMAINTRGLTSIQAIEANRRTRVLIILERELSYELRAHENTISVLLKEKRETGDMPAADDLPSLTGIDFQRTPDGAGRIVVGLEDARMTANVREEDHKIVLTFPDAGVAPQLAHTLDVIDFATPVQMLEISGRERRVRITVFPGPAPFEYASWQSGKQFVLDVRATSSSQAKNRTKNREYGGQKLSLNFQDIPIRSVLQVLAEFTNINIVAGDSVQGNVTLRLNNVPWDQALDLVLKSKGLGKRQEGNIIQIMPQSEINQFEKNSLEAQLSLDEIEPLQTEIIQINYTRAEDIKTVLLGTVEKIAASGNENDGVEQTATTPQAARQVRQETTQSLLSGRGHISIDVRTNQLILIETAKNSEKIKALIKKLDVPVKQVLIESRIVVANNDFTRELGARLVSNPTPTPASASPTGTTASWNALVDLGSTLAAAAGGQFGFTLIKAGNYLLDLELSAAQIEGRGEIISTPRLITSDQTRAAIKQGVQIPYQSAAAGTGTIIPNTVFKEAVLELNVTPHITPEDTILMELLIKKDSPGLPTPSGQIEIDRREIATTVQVDNGETVVLGGVYEGTKNNVTDKVPFLGDLPGLGFLFRRNTVQDNKKELLIFITPKIIKQQTTLQH
ncbi:type IV pilus secretin PilQ [Candidatus Methylospira mobilis]|uniref:Type IV pilus secretin PilQ n=1 Tax=Candidatus Methylospira mobilis TaxID=1808979 RepID=A0A5Q0BK43_9GAMM|nr:type IV pilus secretin PilQ [Candidatus Methylospira mobilis]QFY42537.1 type IV pilus secretin PilQ [Candidatus Methylospira mobilis]WNV04353.1 type IV pilus secretin PilQ [Candidatus Methylospira mobilis]